MISPAIRLYFYGAAAFMLVGGLYAYHRIELHKAHRAGYEAATAEMAAEVSRANAATSERESEVRRASAIKDAEWRGERDELQKQVVDLGARGVSVRLCQPATGGRPVPRATATTAEPHRSGQPEVDPVQDWREVGPELVQLAAECEGYRVRLEELKDRWPQ